MAGATSGRSWMTTVPPFDSSSVSRFAGSAAISAGGRIGSAGAATGASLRSDQGSDHKRQRKQ